MESSGRFASPKTPGRSARLIQDGFPGRAQGRLHSNWPPGREPEKVPIHGCGFAAQFPELAPAARRPGRATRGTRCGAGAPQRDAARRPGWAPRLWGPCGRSTIEPGRLAPARQCGPPDGNLRAEGPPAR